MRRDSSPEAAEAIRSRLRGRTGRAFWRSLDEVSETPAFRAFLEAEFPSLAPANFEIDRRSMLKVMAASLALAGLGGCDGEADEAALPYVEAPEFVVPGNPKWYATAVTMAGYAQPVLGKTHVGRPVKLEGNPDHPATRGATDPFMQAALLGLYDPDRSQSPRHLGRPSTWDAFDAAMTAHAAEADLRLGEGLRLLTGTVTSPTLARQIRALLDRWPRARWHVLEPMGEDLRLEAARLVFGHPLEQHLRLDRAETVVSLDDDFLGPGPRQAVHGRLWSIRRLARQNGDGECRLLVAEPTPSLTGAIAEDRLVTPYSRIAALVRALAYALGAAGGSEAGLSEREQGWVESAAAALEAKRGRALLIVGAQHTPEVQALGSLINERLGGLGETVRFTEPIAASPLDGARSISALVEEMAAGRVKTLAMLDVNPAYTAAAESGFREALARVELRLHAGLYYDETASLSHWHAPLQHELETWSDARAVDGTASIIQPLIRPFYPVRSVHSVVASLLGTSGESRDIVQASWRDHWGDGFNARWRDALFRGFVPDSAFPFVPPTVARRPAVVSEEEVEPEGLFVVMRPDPTIWDGRFANNAWLQETPKPLTKVTWGNVILISPRLSAERGLTTGDEVRLEVAGRSLVGPVWVMPGQEPRTVTVTFGYGRETGRVADGLGYDAFAIRSIKQPWHAAGATLSPTGNRETVASTQLHQAMDGFDFVRTVDPSDLDASKQGSTPGPEAAAEPGARAPTFYPVREWERPSWGMSIDLDLCIGCNACVVACVAENNVPVVGKELVAEGREMHWLRVDHYHEGDPAEPKSFFQPVPCMHCEQAPCEMGCPVNAAVHSFDGLNLQVYNRCIGTRTCSSYCPYKVRRFNWFDYTSEAPEEIQAMRNPDVTVRARGVMEKCTYCVQRISEARISAKIEGRAIRDGEVVTACQQACPTQAIVFGDILDPESRVSDRKADPRDYSLLEEANTWPRTTYLARIEKAPSGGAEDESG